MPDPHPAQNRIIRLPEVQALTGQSRSSVFRRAAAGTFPAPIKLGERSIGWRADEIQIWIATRERVSAKNFDLTAS